MNKSDFYDYDGNFTLPKSVRTYFDSPSHEYKDLDVPTKLIHLAYAFQNGLDLKAEINAMLESHKQIDQSDVQMALTAYIRYLHYPTVKDLVFETLYFDYPYEALLDLLLLDLKVRYQFTTDPYDFITAIRVA